MRILLWHGYLLGGTGSNVYTRSIAREWSRAGHDVVVVSQDANPELHDLGGAQTVRPDIGGAPARVRPRPVRGDAGEAPPGHLAGRARSLRRGQRLRPARARTCRPGLRQSRAPRRPGGSRERPALRRQGPRLRARVLDARQRGARPLGARDARRRPRRLRRLGAHPGGARGRRRPRRSGLRGPSRGRRRDVPAGIADRGAPASCSRRPCATNRTPATRTSGYPTTATPSGSKPSSRRKRRRFSTSAS